MSSRWPSPRYLSILPKENSRRPLEELLVLPESCSSSLSLGCLRVARTGWQVRRGIGRQFGEVAKSDSLPPIHPRNNERRKDRQLRSYGRGLAQLGMGVGF